MILQIELSDSVRVRVPLGSPIKAGFLPEGSGLVLGFSTSSYDVLICGKLSEPITPGKRRNPSKFAWDVSYLIDYRGVKPPIASGAIPEMPLIVFPELDLTLFSSQVYSLDEALLKTFYQWLRNFIAIRILRIA